jgi:hypothetical protein
MIPLVGCVREGQFSDMSAAAITSVSRDARRPAQVDSQDADRAPSEILRRPLRRGDRHTSRRDSDDVTSAAAQFQAHFVSSCGPPGGFLPRAQRPLQPREGERLLVVTGHARLGRAAGVSAGARPATALERKSHGGDELVGKWIGPRSHAVPASIQTARLRSGQPPRSNTTRAPATPKRPVIEPQAR